MGRGPGSGRPRRRRGQEADHRAADARSPPGRAGRGVPRAGLGRTRCETLGRFGATTVYVVDAPELDQFLVAPKAEALAAVVAQVTRTRCSSTSTAEGKEIAARLAVKTGSRRRHRRGRRRSRRHRHAERVRRLVVGDREGHHRHPDHHGEAERRRPRAGRDHPRGRERRRDLQRRRDQREDHRRRAASQGRPPRAHRGRDRGLRRPRRGRARGLRRDRGPRRRARCRGRRLARRDRRGLVPARVPGRADRQDRVARSSTSPTASPVRSSTAPACRRPRRSSRSTRTPRRRSSSSPTTASSATCSRSSPSSPTRSPSARADQPVHVTRGPAGDGRAPRRVLTYTRGRGGCDRARGGLPRPRGDHADAPRGASGAARGARPRRQPLLPARVGPSRPSRGRGVARVHRHGARRPCRATSCSPPAAPRPTTSPSRASTALAAPRTLGVPA